MIPRAGLFIMVLHVHRLHEELEPMHHITQPMAHAHRRGLSLPTQAHRRRRHRHHPPPRHLVALSLLASSLYQLAG